jgi:uncharacterized protein (DUF1800 family)
VLHLLNRTAFGSSPNEITACLSLGKKETVRRLIEGSPLTGREATLQTIEHTSADGKELKKEQLEDQQIYWLYRMANTDSPLIERMTLFWHGHFATSYQKVFDVELMVKQNNLFRKYALGNYYDLVLAIGEDPAMMIWLDVNENRKGSPNENYAREVMELFTLGIGHYTEPDVKEAARAFTGWNYDQKAHNINFQENQHDNNPKTFLGVSGNLNSKDVISAVASDIAKHKTMADVLYNLFISDDFYQEKLMMSLVKSPAEYVVGIMKAFSLANSRNYASAMRQMGQELFLPPDVSGWHGGSVWLVSASLLARYQFAESVASKLDRVMFTSKEWTPTKPIAEDWVDCWSRNLGIPSLSDSSRKSLSSYMRDSLLFADQIESGMRGLLQLLMISPEAQMK